MSATVIPFPGWIEGRPPTASRGSRPNPRRLVPDRLARAWRSGDRRVEVARRLAEADRLEHAAAMYRDYADHLRALLDTWVPSVELFRRVEDVAFPWAELPPELMPEQRHIVIRRVGGWTPGPPRRQRRSRIDRFIDWLEEWI